MEMMNVTNEQHELSAVVSTAPAVSSSSPWVCGLAINLIKMMKAYDTEGKNPFQNDITVYLVI
jgi:hypothetical protein